MSHISSGSSGARSCWCGKPIVDLVSKTNKNPNRAFEFAAEMKLKDDKHFFKWVDETEVSVELKTKKLETEVTELKALVEDMESKLYQKIEIEVEERIISRLELAIAEVNNGLRKKLCLGFVLGCSISVVCCKLIG